MTRKLIGLLEEAVIVCIMVFVVVIMLRVSSLAFIGIFSNEQSEPTKVCRDGELYEVTTEGNITIYDRKAFITCEEKRDDRHE